MKITTKLILVFFILLFSLNLISEQNLNYFQDDNIKTYISDEISSFCGGINYQQYDSLEINNIKLIEVKIADSNSWYENLFSLIINNEGYINDIYKGNFSGFVNVEFENEIFCEFSATIKISGDWKDHLESENLIVSLNINLENGNILGITKFKLLIPKTRSSEDEIFATTLISSLGYVAPKTFFVDAIVNDGKKYRYLFQEKIVKELIESNKFREGPIIQAEGYYRWNNPNYVEENENYRTFLYSTITNLNWATRSAPNKILATEALQKYNLGIYSSFNETEVNYSYFENDTLNIYKFDAINLALNGSHGITPHNRVFYYDKISNQFVPIYYDGYDAATEFVYNQENIDYISEEFLKNKGYFNLKYLAIASKSLLADININLEKLHKSLIEKGFEITLEETKSLKDKLIKNLSKISNFEDGNGKFFKPIDGLAELKQDMNTKLIFIDFETSEVSNCDISLINCKKISDENITNAKVLDEFINIENGNFLHLFGNSPEEFFSSYVSVSDIDNNVDEVKLKIYGNIEYNVDFESNEIKFTILDENSKVLFLGPGNLSNWKISLDDDSLIKNILEPDENLLTGCLTFYNINFQNTVIEINSPKCEDGVNIIRSTGEINNILVYDAVSDAIDLDYSDLEIEKVFVRNSKNDCLDLSGGNYKLSELNLKICGDKGLSVGESSLVSLDKVEISMSLIGVAVKDSSDVTISEYLSNENELCFAIYRKKQEFGPSRLKLNKYSCTDYYVQEGSELVSNGE